MTFVVNGRFISRVAAGSGLTLRFSPQRSMAVLAALPFMGAVLALLGPFGSYSTMTLGTRLEHFAVCCTLIGLMEIEGSYRISKRFFAGSLPLYVALAFDAIGLVPATLLVYASLAAFSPQALPHLVPARLVGQVFITILLFRLIGVVLARSHQGHSGKPVQAPSGQGRSAATFCEKLPMELRSATILALSAEDHYVRVYTASGEAMIHMRLVEAASLLDEGFQIHRSHWIQRRAIRHISSGRIQLVNGISLPVSRYRWKDFKDWYAESPRPEG